MTPEIVAWLTADNHDTAGWAPEPPLDELHCHPDLVERLTAVSRPVVRGAARVWVDGCPVIHHRRGAPLACASGTGVLVVRSGAPAGALAASGKTSGLDDTWVDLDPWAADTAFARSTELLRMHLRRASELAEARAWR